MSSEDSVSRRGFLKAAGGAGAVAGATGGVAAQEGTTSTGNDTSGGSSGGGATKTVDLVDYAFNPGTDSPLYIKPGTTVKFVWKTGGHNIHVDSQPDGASWSGHEAVEGSGYTYSHTFKTKGKYHYWCVPHKSLGMVADIVVNDSGQPPGGPGGYQSILPESAKVVGVGATGAMVAVLGLAYFLMRYGGEYEAQD